MTDGFTRTAKRSLGTILAVGILAGCSSGAGSSVAPANSEVSRTLPGGVAAATITVKISNDAYVPVTVKIKKGTTVSFTNRDFETHTVTAKDGSFGSPPMVFGSTWKHLFKNQGKYPYYCKIHPFMNGLVVVTR
jgi:plastocyanin